RRADPRGGQPRVDRFEPAGARDIPRRTFPALTTRSVARKKDGTRATTTAQTKPAAADDAAAAPCDQDPAAVASRARGDDRRRALPEPGARGDHGRRPRTRRAAHRGP